MKRPRERSNVETQAIAIFEDLANPDEGIRLKAAAALLQQYNPEQALERKEVEKTLGKLIRGLCSGRKAARIGFSTALTELLSQLWVSDTKKGREIGIDENQILQLIADKTQITGKGQEARDHYFGQLFSLEALIKSGLPFARTSVQDLWAKVLDNIFSLAKQKSFLREEAGFVLCSALDVLKTHPDGSDYANTLLRKSQQVGLGRTPEGVAIWLKASSFRPKLELPKDVWDPHPLDQRNLSLLGHVLFDTVPSEPSETFGSGKVKQRGTWTPRLHFVWDAVLPIIIDEDKRRKESTMNGHKSKKKHKSNLPTFQEFWHEVIDTVAFTGSDERKYTGYLIFQKCASMLPKGTLSEAVSRNFVRTIVAHAPSPDRPLHGMVRKTLDFMVNLANTGPWRAFELVHGLTKDTAYINFDSLTKSKTVEKLICAADEDALDSVVDWFEGIIACIEPDKANNNDDYIPDSSKALFVRNIAADILSGAVRAHTTSSPSQQPEKPWRLPFEEHILRLLWEFAYFTYDMDVLSPEHSKPPLDDTTRKIFGSRLLSCLTYLLSKAVDPAKVAYKTVSDIRIARKRPSDPTSGSAKSTKLSMVFSPPGSDLQFPNEDIDTFWELLEEVVVKEQSTEGAEKDMLTGLKFLFSIALLEALNGEEDGMSLLDDLRDTYERLIRTKSSDSRGEGTEILIEILLGLISKPLTLFKRLGQQVFSTCTSTINSRGLKSLLKVLATPENVGGQAEIFANADEEQGSDSEDEEVSDVEMIDNNEDKDDSVSGTDASEASLEDEDEGADGDEKDEELADFDAKLAEALGTHRSDIDLDATSGSDSDSDMDDEQMEALDAQLENVFRERMKSTSKKAEKKEAKENMIVFKGRILELLEVYIKQEHQRSTCTELILPLLILLRDTTSKSITDKAYGLLKEYLKRFKLKDRFKNIDNSTNQGEQAASSQTILDLLTEVHTLAQNAESNVLAAACSQASILLAKIAITQGMEVRLVAERYANTQAAFLKEKACKVRPAFFTEWNNWCVSARQSLAEEKAVEGKAKKGKPKR
ncbi:DNA-directed DNA polymerase [Agyrium rufum]|nr:DNA-directed DNA polymerase [Agyrium rufum]